MAANAAKLAKVERIASPIWPVAQKQGVPPVTHGGPVPSIWADGLARLDPGRRPTGFPAPWWCGLIRDAELFLSMWGSQADGLGWTSLDLFGVHPAAPAARFSCTGLLLLLRGGRVIAITADSAVIERQSGARLTYTRRPPDAECVAVWELPSNTISAYS
jgi:hypothetical protein